MNDDQTIIIYGNRVQMMYTETGPIRPSKVGRIVQARKVSDVKFDAALQKWVAIDRKTGKIVARDSSRKKCVLKEHAHYERELARRRIPWNE